MAVHDYNLRSKTNPPQNIPPVTQVIGWKDDDSDDEKVSLRRIFSIRRSKNKKKDQAETSDTQMNGQSSTIPKKSKKTKGDRKRKLPDAAESNTEVVEDLSKVKNKKKSKKAKDDKTSTTPQLNSAAQSLDLDKESDDKRQLEEIPPEAEQAKVSTDTESSKPITETVVSQLADKYEEKCLKKIREIFEKAKEFESRIATFSGIEGGQEFYYLDENLQRNIEKLDRIDVMDSVKLKEERKNAIKYIYSVIEKLETKAYENGYIEPNVVNID